jgi:hypothetical protein
MKLSDAREAYEALSGKASDIVRQISLAGIALIWVFKSGSQEAPVIDGRLIRASLFIFIALFCDFLQYLAGTTIWVFYFRYKEVKRTKETADFQAPPQLNWPMWGLFYLKAAAMVWAYARFIIPFLYAKFH